LGWWICPQGHTVEYDGVSDGLFSLRQSDDSGSVLVFSRSFCDVLVSFVFNSRSSYSAATSFLASLRSGFTLRRQLIVTLGRCFVATLRPTQDAFVCPLCGDDPAYIVIDGQALGFRVKDGLNITRPALHLPSMNLSIDNYAVIRPPSIRAAIRKVLRTGDPITKTEADALLKLHQAPTAVFPRGRTAAARENWRLQRDAATLFFRFHTWTAVDDIGGARAAPAAGVRRPRGHRAGPADAPSAAPDDAAAGAAANASADTPSNAPAAASDAQVEEPPICGLGNSPDAASPSLPSDEREGTCRPRFDTFKAGGTEWATVRPFILALLGDPVVNLFVGHAREPLMELVDELKKPDGSEWQKKATAANAVGFVANFFARVGTLLKKEPPLRLAVGSLLQFAVEVDHVVDKDFAVAAQKAAAGGQVETAAFCKRWLNVSSPAEYAKFAAEHPEFKGKDIDSPYTSFEYFGFLKRVRPAIYTPRARPKRTAEQQPARGRGRRGAQAAKEDAGDRCAKSFPKHSELTAGVFNIVCPHVVTMGFRVMFQAESVADALSVILERFPKLPKVVFYDVACKMDRNGMQRVRTILSHHGVRFCLDRAHAKGHTCSCVYFPDESLAVTNGVSTQAAEVQHSVSVKFRGHLAYMSPTAFMAHRIFQLSMMNLTASFKVHHPTAKAENEGTRLNHYYYNYRNAKCLRPTCTCPARQLDALVASPSGDDGGHAGATSVKDLESGERAGWEPEKEARDGERSESDGEIERRDGGDAHAAREQSIERGETGGIDYMEGGASSSGAGENSVHGRDGEEEHIMGVTDVVTTLDA